MSDIVLNVNSACNNAKRKGLQDRWASLLSQFQDYLRIMRKSTTLFFSIIVAFYVNTWSKNVMLFNTLGMLVCYKIFPCKEPIRIPKINYLILQYYKWETISKVRIGNLTVINWFSHRRKCRLWCQSTKCFSPIKEESSTFRGKL